jgi:hypothetical protein
MSPRFSWLDSGHQIHSVLSFLGDGVHQAVGGHDLGLDETTEVDRLNESFLRGNLRSA